MLAGSPPAVNCVPPTVNATEFPGKIVLDWEANTLCPALSLISTPNLFSVDPSFRIDAETVVVDVGEPPPSSKSTFWMEPLAGQPEFRRWAPGTPN